MFEYLIIGGMVLIMFILADIHHQLKKVAKNTEKEKGFLGMNHQDLTSICLKCGVDLGNCICKKTNYGGRLTVGRERD